MKAPSFSLPDQTGTIRSLEEFRGSWLVLYFYPKDDTPGCTKEACSFRDQATPFRQAGAVIAGVSKDTVASHRKFAGKHALTFPLLSDESKEMIKAYGAWGEKKFMGRTFEGVLRKTVLIGKDGTIVKTYDKVNPFTHAAEVLKDITAGR